MAKPSKATPRYKPEESFFKAAIQKAVTDSLFSPVSLAERHNVKLKPGFDTACWAYLPPHNIYIGTNLFEKDNLKPGLSEDQLSRYIENHYHHELGHALYTERDMAKIKRALKTIDAPFGIYNLFEDAWMERRYGKEAEYRFNWLEIENLSFNARPESLLFGLIQAEGDLTRVRTALEAWVASPPAKDAPEDSEQNRKDLAALLPRVATYYEKIVAVSASMQLMPLLNAWLDEFGRPPQSMNLQGLQDMAHTAELMSGGQSAQEFDAGTKTVAGQGEPSMEGASEKATAAGSDTPVASKGTVLGGHRTSLDYARVEALAAKFVRFFEAKSRMTSTLTPQKRVSARHFALGRSPYRKAELVGRGVKTVFFEVDCSGSMQGSHINEGKLVIAALSRLARKGMLRGHVALSAIKGGPCYETFSLPMSDATIEQIQAYAGAEGLAQTLQANRNLAKEADYVFVYTDGQICDKPIDKAALHQYGIFTWGLYVGNDESYLEELLLYFDKALLRKTAEDLVDAMLAQR